MKIVSEEKVGGCTLRIAAIQGKYRGVVIRGAEVAASLDDDDATRLLSRLRNEAGTLHPNYVGMDGAIARFLHFFPEGFNDPLYLADERSYKEQSAERLRAVLPLGEAINASPSRAAEARVAFVTNLLSPFELARASAVLRGPTGASFVQGAARFTMGEYSGGLHLMAKAVEPHGRVSWPIVTYLPNLRDSGRHMFLKPNATKDFAERIGHRFQYDYEARLSACTYENLLTLVADTEAGLQQLNPRDRTDVQSFIWVVGDYGKKELAELAARRA